MLDGEEVDQMDYRFNNKLLEDKGIEKIITAASTQKAGRFGLFNTPDFLKEAEIAGLTFARMFGVQPFNRYRERFNLPAYDSIDGLAGNDQVAAALRAVYGDNVDDVELTIGLLAERRDDDDLMPETVVRMVAYDAFTHILTNPLLSTEVYCPETFSKVGWEIVEQRATLDEIIKRNVGRPDAVTASLSA